MGIKKIVIISHLLILISSLSIAQTWKWAVQPQAAGSTFADPSWCDRYVASDRAGNAYITGLFSGIFGNGQLIFGSDILSTTSPLKSAIYIAKYDSNGHPLWAKQSSMYNSFSAAAPGIALDNNSNAFIAGTIVRGTTYFNTFQVTTPNADMCLAKYDQTGNILWATQSFSIDRTSYAKSTSVATDKWGNVFVTGYFIDTVSFGTNTLRSNHHWCAFLAKYNTNGGLIWAKQSLSLTSTSASDEAYSVATDTLGDAYITGIFSDTIGFSSFTLTGTAGYPNMFLVKYDSGGNVSWANQAHTLANGYIAGQSVTTDNTGSAYVLGNIHGMVCLSTDTLISSTGISLYLARYNPNGNLLWAEQNNATDPSPWYAMTLVSDTLKRGGGYLLTRAGTTSIPGFFELRFGGKTIQDSTPGVSASDAILQFDTLGKVMCSTIFTEGGFEDDGTSVGVSPSSIYIYTTGDIDGHTQIGNDSLTEDSDVVFLARWQTCCGIINDNMQAISDTCNAANGIAIAHTNGTYGPFSFVWNPTGNTDSTAHSLSAGKYTVIINDANGCAKKDSVIITNVNGIPAQACCDTTIISGHSVVLNVDESGKYTWTPSAGLSCDTCQNTTASPDVTTEYYVTTISKNGCSTTDSVLVTVKEKCGQLFVPNAFSPNGDNIDDIEYVYGGCIQALDFKIFDRWGNLVFETTDPTKGWNGTYNGKPMNSGVYDYTLVALQSNGKTTDQKGNITLVR